MFLKSESGLIEEENFYLSHPTDFLGSNSEYCIKDNTFTIASGIVERNFLYDEFVMQLEYRYSPIENGSIFFYVKNSNKQRMGIMKTLDNEGDDTEYNFWKIVFYKGFLQVYKSIDTTLWINIGGTKVKNPIEIQGFELKGSSPFILRNYKVYKNSYLTIYNYPRNYKARILDLQQNIIKEEPFDNLNQCHIFLDYCFTGKIQILDTENNLVNETKMIDINYGDEYLLSPYDIEVYYDSDKIEYSTTNINYPSDKVTVKNISNEIYSNLNVSISEMTDNIQISLDGINFNENIVIDVLEPQQSKDIYIKIKGSNNKNKGYKNFNINIG